MSGKSDEKSTLDIMMMVTKTSPSMLAFSQSSKKEKKTAVDGDVLKAIKDACDIAEISITTVTGKVTCTQAGGKDDFLYMVDNGGTKVKASGLTALQKTDIEMTNQNKFKKYNKTDNKKCSGADIVGKEWKLTSGSNEVGEASESPYKEKSCMVCLQGGAIYFVSSGQVLGDFETVLEEIIRMKGTEFSYLNKDGDIDTIFWNISNEDFIDANALSLEQITDICKRNNPGLVEKGFDLAIYELSSKKQINPKIILATLGQEQNWCKKGNYQKAFGVGPGGTPTSFSENSMGGLETSIDIYIKSYNEGLELELQGDMPELLINYDPKPYKETTAVYKDKVTIQDPLFENELRTS